MAVARAPVSEVVHESGVGEYPLSVRNIDGSDRNPITIDAVLQIIFDAANHALQTPEPPSTSLHANKRKRFIAVTQTRGSDAAKKDRHVQPCPQKSAGRAHFSRASGTEPDCPEPTTSSHTSGGSCSQRTDRMWASPLRTEFVANEQQATLRLGNSEFPS